MKLYRSIDLVTKTCSAQELIPILLVSDLWVISFFKFVRRWIDLTMEKYRAQEP